MKPVFTLLFFFLLLQTTQAQVGPNTIRADVSGILYFSRFQQDTLVPPKRRGGTGVVTEIMANGYYDFAGKKKRWQYRVGMGYSRKEIVMNKHNLGDIFFAFFPFVGARPDTFRLTRIRYQYDYLNLPVGFSYRLTRNAKSWFQAQAGLQANVGFRVSKEVDLVFDPSATPPSAAETAQIKNAYNAGASAVVVGVLPRLDLNFRIYKNLGIFYSAQIYTLQLNSLQPKLVKGGVGLGGGIGAYVKL